MNKEQKREIQSISQNNEVFERPKTRYNPDDKHHKKKKYEDSENGDDDDED
jgi:hypothetical protein